MSTLRAAIDDAACAGTLLVAADFDGTLAELVDDPASAVLHPTAAAALTVLCACARTFVIVISGRSLAELRPRFAHLPALELFGSHGNEPLPSAATDVDLQRYNRLSRVLSGIAQHAEGAWVESKPLSLVLHFRAVSPARREELLHMLGVFIPPAFVERAIVGRDTVEYLFADSDKGRALRRAIECHNPDSAIFFGDDVTDEAAFAALRPGDISVKIGPEPTLGAHRVQNVAEAIATLETLAELRSKHLECPPAP